MSGTVCCYAGCKKNYSTDKDISFFKFPDDPKRRKKWMQNSGNVALESLPERQLRGKRICSDHFTEKSFQRPESKTALNDTAVPIVAKTGKTEPPPSPAAGRFSKGKIEKKDSAKPEPAAEKTSKANTDNVPAVKTPVPAKEEKETPQKSVTRKSAATASVKTAASGEAVEEAADVLQKKKKAKPEPPPSPVAGRLSKRKIEKKDSAKTNLLRKRLQWRILIMY